MSFAGPDFHAGLERVYRTEYARLVAVVSRLTGNHSRAEDLVAEAMCRISARSALFRPDGNLEGWLYRTALNLGLNALKAESRRLRYERAATVEDLRTRGEADPLTDMLRAEQQRKVRTVLSSLKHVEAQLLLLRHEGLSYQETALALRLNPASIGTLLARAMARFKTKYAELFGGDS